MGTERAAYSSPPPVKDPQGWFARLRASKSILFIGALGLCMTVALFWVARTIEQRWLLGQFRAIAADRAHAVHDEIESELHALEALRGLFHASSDVTYSEFETFVDSTLTWAEGVQAVEWVPRVRGSQREAFEGSIRAAGLEGFAITERTEEGAMAPASPRAEYFPVHYVVPRRGNEPAIGFDVASDPVRYEALNAARRSNEARASAPITLVQERGEQRGVLVFLPVFRSGLEESKSGRTDEKLQGFVLGVFRVGDLLDTALAELAPAGICIELFDESAAPAPEPLAHFCSDLEASRGDDSPAAERGPGLDHGSMRSVAAGLQERFRTDVVLDWAGRRWRVSGVPTAGFFEARQQWASWAILIAGLLLTFVVTGYLLTSSGRKRAELALSRSEERNRLILDNALDAIITIDSTGTITAWEGAAEAMFGWSRTEAIGRALGELIVPEHLRARHEEGMVNFRKTGRRGILERRVQFSAVHRDRHEFPVELTVTVIGEGDAAEFNGFIRDVSDRVAVERSLQQAMDRFRILVEHAPEAIVVLDGDTGRFTDVNDNAVRLFKMSREDLLESGPFELSPPIQPNGRKSEEYGREMIDKAFCGEAPVFEWSHIDGEGEEVTCEIRLVQLPSEGPRLLRGSITDITERKRAEQRQRTLMRELDHRVKNNLAAVLSITEQSLATSNTLDEFQAAFTGRIRSLARLHIALARTEWEGADLEEIANLTLGAHMVADRGRIELEGPRTVLSAEASSAVCMALHELTTNASKYGALSVPQGKVRLTWSTENGGPLRLTWQESGGPSVSAPTREGYGFVLIKGVIEYELEGRVDLRFLPEGLYCEIEIPASARADLAA